MGCRHGFGKKCRKLGTARDVGHHRKRVKVISVRSMRYPFAVFFRLSRKAPLLRDLAFTQFWFSSFPKLQNVTRVMWCGNRFPWLNADEATCSDAPYDISAKRSSPRLDLEGWTGSRHDPILFSPTNGWSRSHVGEDVTLQTVLSQQSCSWGNSASLVSKWKITSTFITCATNRPSPQRVAGVLFGETR